MMLMPIACILLGVSLVSSLPYMHARDTGDYLSERYDDGGSNAQQNDNGDMSSSQYEEPKASLTDDDDSLSERTSENDKRDDQFGRIENDSDSFIDKSGLNWTTEDNWVTSGDNGDADVNHEKKSHSHYVNGQEHLENV